MWFYCMLSSDGLPCFLRKWAGSLHLGPGCCCFSDEYWTFLACSRMSTIIVWVLPAFHLGHHSECGLCMSILRTHPQQPSGYMLHGQTTGTWSIVWEGGMYSSTSIHSNLRCVLAGLGHWRSGKGSCLYLLAILIDDDLACLSHLRYVFVVP